MKRERDEEEDWGLGHDSRAQVPRLEGPPATAAPEVCALSLPVFPLPFPVLPVHSFLQSKIALHGHHNLTQLFCP